MGNGRGRSGTQNLWKVYLRVMVQQPQGRKLCKKICSRTSHLTSSQDDADSKEDRHEPDWFGLLP